MLSLHVNELFVTFGLSTCLPFSFHITFFAFNTSVCMFVCLRFGDCFNLCVWMAIGELAYLSQCIFVSMSVCISVSVL